MVKVKVYLEDKCIFKVSRKETLKKMSINQRKILNVDTRDKGKYIDVLITAEAGKKKRAQNNAAKLLKGRPIA